MVDVNTNENEGLQTQSQAHPISQGYLGYILMTYNLAKNYCQSQAPSDELCDANANATQRIPITSHPHTS